MSKKKFLFFCFFSLVLVSIIFFLIFKKDIFKEKTISSVFLEHINILKKTEKNTLNNSDFNKVDSIDSKKGLSLELKNDSFVELKTLSENFIYDLKYATNDNFLNEAVYNCAKCYLRYEVAKALITANQNFKKDGYKIKLYDCYRPVSAQKKMWEIMPNHTYVANPYTTGSVHNRGGAVDLTLVDIKTNQEVNMGTDFDYFGDRAAHFYTNLETEVINNRKYLKKIMQESGFEPNNYEWWHYSYTKKDFPIADFEFECN